MPLAKVINLCRSEKKQKNEMDMELYKLYTILIEYDDWWNGSKLSESERDKLNEEARQALVAYLKLLKKVGVSKQPSIKPLSTFYPTRMANIEEAFRDKLYMRVCNEVISHMYYDPFRNEETFHDFVGLLERNLGIA